MFVSLSRLVYQCVCRTVSESFCVYFKIHAFKKKKIQKAPWTCQAPPEAQSAPAARSRSCREVCSSPPTHCQPPPHPRLLSSAENKEFPAFSKVCVRVRARAQTGVCWGLTKGEWGHFFFFAFLFLPRPHPYLHPQPSHPPSPRQNRPVDVI